MGAKQTKEGGGPDGTPDGSAHTTPHTTAGASSSGGGGGGGAGGATAQDGSASAPASGTTTAASAAAATQAASGDGDESGSEVDGKELDLDPSKRGWLAVIKEGYAELINAIIRPPRAEYNASDLGPAQFTWRGRKFERQDLELKNARGHTLVCSHWKPVDSERPMPQLPCVVYLHGNASCRLAAMEILEVCLADGMTVFALDFSGSGMSGGEFVTLGFHEKDDVAAVIEHLRKTGQVSTIALWGRSMGAATALLHGHRDPSIAALVLDSPFADLHQLANEMVSVGKEATGIRVPAWVLKPATKVIQSSVLKKTGMDLYKLKPIANVAQCFIPALFTAGEDDDFIRPQHSQAIYDAYAGDKNLVLVPGGHNTARPRFFMDSAAIFLRTALQIPPEIVLPNTGPSLAQAWSSGSASRTSLFAPRSTEDLMLQQVMMASMAMSPGEAAAATGPGDSEDERRALMSLGLDDIGLNVWPQRLDGPTTDWACPACTYNNEAGASVCAVCGQLYLEPESPQQAPHPHPHVELPFSPLPARDRNVEAAALAAESATAGAEAIEHAVAEGTAALTVAAESGNPEVAAAVAQPPTPSSSDS